jgi:hypothetical protein
MFLKHYDQALELVRVDIDRLEPECGSGSPVYLSLYGILFLAGAVTAARANKPAVARDLLDEGQSVTRRLGYDGNEYFTSFGPMISAGYPRSGAPVTISTSHGVTVSPATLMTP